MLHVCGGRSMRIFISILAFMTTSMCRAWAADLITQPEASMLVTPQVYNGTVIGKLGDTSVTNPSWVIQMGQGLPPLAGGAAYTSQPGVSWAAYAGAGRVQYYAAPASGQVAGAYELAVNAQTGATPCSQELDLFAQAIQPPNPNGSGGYKDPNGNVVASRAGQSTTLNQVSVINMQLGLTIPYESIIQKCTDINRVTYLAEVSARSSKGVFMFYQIHFRDSANPYAYNVSCYPPSQTAYCFDTNASLLGGPQNQPVSGTRVFYNLDLLSGIKAAIARTSDTNLADWHIEVGYFGTSLEGGVSTSSDWDSFRVSVY